MRCVQVGIVRVRMLGVIETFASVMGDAAAVSCRAAVSFAFADMQMPDLMHAGDQLAVTECQNEQGMNELSGFHRASIVADKMSCQIIGMANSGFACVFGVPSRFTENRLLQGFD